MKLDNNTKTQLEIIIDHCNDTGLKAGAGVLKEFIEQQEDNSLTLATLCDIVMGEDAPDRSNDALIKAVRQLKEFHWLKGY